MHQRRPTRLSLFRKATASRRMLPRFLVIGAQRGGSTSFCRYLAQHPWIDLAVQKEVHYFDFNFHRPLAWYRAHFPTVWRAKWVKRKEKHPLLSGEGTPYYLAHPHAPRRAAATVPRARLIALLRNPIDRAYSHYQHVVKNGLEPLRFEDAIAAEAERVEPELERMMADETYYSRAHHRHSYLTRGSYVDQLRAWGEQFGAEQLLVLRSEDLFGNLQATMRRAFEFLGLPDHSIARPRKYTACRYEPMRDATRRRLVEHFAPQNRELAGFLGWDPGWDS